MNPIALGLVLAALWVAVTGDLAVSNILVALVGGISIGYLAHLPGDPLTPLRRPHRPVRRLLALPGFLLFYLWELFKSNLVVASDVLSPRLRAHPAIIALPLDVQGPGAITLLSNLITMTPGTLTLDVSDDRTTLYVHAMYASHPDAARDAIKNGLERRVKELLP